MFLPTPTLSTRLIDALCSADLSLRDVADMAETSLEELTLWLETEQVQTRIAALHSAMLMRTRLVCANSLPLVVTALKTILKESLHLLDRTPQDTRDLRLVSIRSRTHESARRACGLLMRLSTINTPLNPKPRAPSTAPAAIAQGESTGTAAQAALATPEAPSATAPGASTCIPSPAPAPTLKPQSSNSSSPVPVPFQTPKSQISTSTPPDAAPEATSIISAADPRTRAPGRDLTLPALHPVLQTTPTLPASLSSDLPSAICSSAIFLTPALVELTIAESG